MTTDQADERRFISRMQDGRFTVGFDDGALIFECAKDAESASWLLAQAFKIAYAHKDAYLNALEAQVRELTQERDALKDIGT